MTEILSVVHSAWNLVADDDGCTKVIDSTPSCISLQVVRKLETLYALMTSDEKYTRFLGYPKTPDVNPMDFMPVADSLRSAQFSPSLVQASGGNNPLEKVALGEGSDDAAVNIANVYRT